MKVALLADLHFGVKKNDQTFQESQLRFFNEQFVPELKEKNINDIIICGDIFDSRQSINVNTDNVVINLFKNSFTDFNIHIIVGNHDMYHTNTTEVNSLKSLELLPNVTLYEKPTEIIIDDKKILMLPWITKYEDFEQIVLNNYEYAFAHLDIVGFDMGNQLCTEGLTAARLVSRIKHTYTGHFHCRIHKEYVDGQTITYIGSPYQITRNDRGTERGYGILDIENNSFEWVDNQTSMKFTKYIYPDVDETKITGNQVDIEIPFAMQNETKKIYDLVQKLNSLGPAYPVNTFIGENTEEESEISVDVNALNLLTIFKTYVEQLETKLDKNKIYNELVKLYDTFKGANQ